MKKESKEEIDVELKYRVLIIYDITDDRHRLKLSKYLSSFGTRVQKSAFEAKLNKKQYIKLITGLERLICKEDNVRIYKRYEDSEIITYGEFNEDEFEEVVII